MCIFFVHSKLLCMTDFDPEAADKYSFFSDRILRKSCIFPLLDQEAARRDFEATQPSRADVRVDLLAVLLLADQPRAVAVRRRHFYLDVHRHSILCGQLGARFNCAAQPLLQADAVGRRH